MISVNEAVARIARGLTRLSSESVMVAEAAGRVLAEDAVARLDHPPTPMSAMDGYAVRRADARAGAEFSIIGEAPAGRPFPGRIGEGQAVRIFTGGVVPEGADAVVIQEDTVPLASNDGVVLKVRITETPYPDENVRPRGLDFRKGEILLPRGHRISPRDVALIAAGDLAKVSVIRKPCVALVATGDELSRPGEPRKDGGIVASSIYALQAMVRQWGGEAIDAGILPDRPEAFAALPEATKNADLVVTQGGASVGDHDLVQSALKPFGFTLDFWRIAMRPGKPLIFGRLRDTPFIGLPGNPVSAMVCAVLFIQPAIAAMLGMTYEPPIVKARLGSALRANGRRQDYIRTRLVRHGGILTAEPFAL
ncbi:MAG TPA: gephyrin-like molybdotransferase Glp, partial [Micropepsaceae bacterium]